MTRDELRCTVIGALVNFYGFATDSVVDEIMDAFDDFEDGRIIGEEDDGLE